MPPPYTPALMLSIQRTITQERLTRYLRATGGNVSRALELYELNVQLSTCLYGLLHGLEITVRNAEHHALTTSYGTASWYDLAPLTAYWVDQVNKAKAKPGVGGIPGKVVAELTFGFWVDLLQNRHHWNLWVRQKLHTAFPNARLHRSKIHDRLKEIQLIRNRISHHEPIITASNAIYNGDALTPLPDLLECIEWVCADTAQWIQAEFKYVEAQRILRDVAAMGITL